MPAISNGVALHGGLIPFAGTFLIFSDYMRPAIRLAALMKLHVIYVFTHDSVALGEDGPTHQPVEQLASLRIESQICPSFLGNVDDFPITYKHSDKPNVFISGHPDREDEYGFSLVKKIADEVPECTFHLYGSDNWGYAEGKKNVIYHGRVPKEQFNKEIRDFQCGLRLNKSDGASEIMVKSVLNGGYPITFLQYPMVDNFQTKEELIRLLKDLKNKKEPNLKARKYYYETLNNFPWNLQKHQLV